MDEALSEREESSWIARSVIILAALAAVYAGATIWLAKDAWLKTFGTLSWRDLAVVISFVAVGLLIRAVRWHYYLHLAGWKIPLRYSVTAFIASIALTVTPGKAGEIIKFFLLRSHFRISIFEGTGILVVERVGDLVAVVLLSAAGLTLFVDLRSYFLIGVVLIAVAMSLICVPRLRRLTLLQLTRIRLLDRLSGRLIAMGDAMNVLLRPMPCLIGGLLALIAWSSEASAFYILLDRLEIPASPLIAASIFGFATLAGVLSMLPGGVGGYEVVMGLLLTKLGASLAVATVAVVLFRACTLWLFSVIGLGFLVGWLTLLTRIAAKR
jgi:uncharacterized protein (TIRG00374 family)